MLVPHSMHGAQPGAQRWAPCHNSPVFPGLWRHHRGKAMTFSGLGAALLGFGSSRSWTNERTGTPLTANLLCQPHAIAWMCSQQLQCSAFCLYWEAAALHSIHGVHSANVSVLPIAWGASAGRTGHGARSGASSRYECTSGTGEMGGVSSMHLQRSVPSTCIPATPVPSSEDGGSWWPTR